MTKIEAVTPDMIAAKAPTILLEEEKPSCKPSGKNHGVVCWDELPDLTPESYKERGEPSGSAPSQLKQHWPTNSRQGSLTMVFVM